MKVILAVDGSPCSNAAMGEAISREWKDGTELMVLAAVHTRIPEITDPLLVMAAARVEMMEQENKRMRTLVERVAAMIRDSKKGKNLKIETRVVEGSPKEVILDESNRWQADLILMGCHGYGNVKRFMLGSVSQAVALHAPCSVQIVRTKHE